MCLGSPLSPGHYRHVFGERVLGSGPCGRAHGARVRTSWQGAVRGRWLCGGPKHCKKLESWSGRRLPGEQSGCFPASEHPLVPACVSAAGEGGGGSGNPHFTHPPIFYWLVPVVLPTPLSHCRLRGAWSQGSSRQPLRTERWQRPRQAVRCGRMA